MWNFVIVVTCKGGHMTIGGNAATTNVFPQLPDLRGFDPRNLQWTRNMFGHKITNLKIR
jgi:hypothetical protein